MLGFLPPLLTASTYWCSQASLFLSRTNFLVFILLFLVSFCIKCSRPYSLLKTNQVQTPCYLCNKIPYPNTQRNQSVQNYCCSKRGNLAEGLPGCPWLQWVLYLEAGSYEIHAHGDAIK